MEKIKEVVPTTQRKPEIISPLNLGEEKKMLCQFKTIIIITNI